MIKHVLIVDDDEEMLFALKSGLDKYHETFSVLTAGDGLFALEVLKKHPVSLVVTDLKMPNMDGFTLLSQIMEHYPDIPVIIMTAYSTPKMERLAREGGAVGYIKKPFMIDDLAVQVITTMRKESEGGTLHGVSSGMFLQLIEMEERTCTIRLMDNSTGKQGVLFFQNGDLMDARLDDRQGLEAAYGIFAWDEVTLSIQNVCPQREKKISGDLQAILLEAMRLKDEAERERPSEGKPAETAYESKEAGPQALGEKEIIDRIRNKIKQALGGRCGMEDIYPDLSWKSIVHAFKEVGDIFEAGELKVAYVDTGRPNDFIVLPGESITVISVNPKCPRDRLIRLLAD
jgi:CheY-like chemotaxis protein